MKMKRINFKKYIYFLDQDTMIFAIQKNNMKEFLKRSPNVTNNYYNILINNIIKNNNNNRKLVIINVILFKIIFKEMNIKINNNRIKIQESNKISVILIFQIIMNN